MIQLVLCVLCGLELATCALRVLHAAFDRRRRLFGVGVGSRGDGRNRSSSSTLVCPRSFAVSPTHTIVQTTTPCGCVRPRRLIVVADHGVSMNARNPTLPRSIAPTRRRSHHTHASSKNSPSPSTVPLSSNLQLLRFLTLTSSFIVARSSRLSLKRQQAGKKCSSIGWPPRGFRALVALSMARYMGALTAVHVACHAALCLAR